MGSLLAVPAANASPTKSELKNCEANIRGVPQSAAVKASVCAAEDGYLGTEAGKLDLKTLPLISKPRAKGFQIVFSASGPSSATTLADTRPNGKSPCLITLYPGLWKQFGQASGSIGLEGDFVLAHETVHCYQFDYVGGGTIPNWILEGSAEYLAADLVGATPPRLATWWNAWFNPKAPQTHTVTTMSYNAIGWFSLVANVHGSLWSEMPHAWYVSTHGGSPAFIKAIGGDSTQVTEEWGPSLLNDSSWGGAWVAHGPGLGDASGILFSTPATGSTHGTIKPWTGQDFDESVGQGILTITVTGGGYASVHDQAGQQGSVGFTSATFCTAARGCSETPTSACGEEGGEPPPSSLPQLSQSFVLALASAGSSASYTIQLKPVTPLPPSKPQCPNNGTASDGGDPHLLSFGVREFDFMAAGEFTLLRSRTGDGLDVQVRQQPFPRSTFASINTAVAIRDGPATVEVDASARHGIVLFLNHDSIPTASRALAGGGSLQVSHYALPLPRGQTAASDCKTHGARGKQLAPCEKFLDALAQGTTTVDIVWPDGTTVEVTGELTSADAVHTAPSLTVGVRLARDRLGHVTGLLGSAGEPVSRQFEAANGKFYKLGTLQDGGSSVYEGYGASWRITQRESLFTYPRGKNTHSYTILNFPKGIVDVGHASGSKRAQAKEECEEAGVSNPVALKDCVYDVLATGSPAAAIGDTPGEGVAGGSGTSAPPSGSVQLTSIALGPGTSQPTIAYDPTSHDTYVVWIPDSAGDVIDICTVTEPAPSCNGGAGPDQLVDQLAASGGASPIVFAAMPVVAPGGEVTVLADLDGSNPAADAAGYVSDGVVAWSSPAGGAAFGSADQGIADGGQELAPSVASAPQNGAIALTSSVVAVYGNEYPFGSGFTDFTLSAPAPASMPVVDTTGDYGSQIGVTGGQLAAVPDPSVPGKYIVVAVGAASSVAPPGCGPGTSYATGYGVALGTPAALATQAAWTSAYFEPISCDAADPVLAGGGAAGGSIGLLETEGPGLDGSGSDGLYYRAFDPASSSFGAPTLVSDETDVTLDGPADVSLGADTAAGIYASWLDARGFELSYSSDGGSSWTAPVTVGLSPGASDPVVAGAGGGSGELAYTDGSQEYIAAFSGSQLLP